MNEKKEKIEQMENRTGKYEELQEYIASVQSNNDQLRSENLSLTTGI